MATTGSTLDLGGNRAVKTPAGSLLANRYRLDAADPARSGLLRGDRSHDRRAGAGQARAAGRDAAARGRSCWPALDHPSIVRLKDAGRDGDLPFVVLEWIDGGDLEAFMARSGGPSPMTA